MHAVTVRLATPDDADAIERVRTDTWRATYRGLMPDLVLDALGYDGARRRQQMAAMAADRFALVAEHDAEVVGFAYGGPSRSEEPQHPGEVYAVCLLTPHQTPGHAAALMRV